MFEIVKVSDFKWDVLHITFDRDSADAIFHMLDQDVVIVQNGVIVRENI